jgi:hypothetical protein
MVALLVNVRILNLFSLANIVAHVTAYFGIRCKMIDESPNLLPNLEGA